MAETELNIPRKSYMDWLLRWKDRQLIKVVSGVRRSGKSTLFEQYRSHLLELGVRQEQIIALNFEDVTYDELLNYRKLYDYISERLLPGQMNYIFLDEIQHVESFEKAVDSLFIKKNCDVYITGSNAYFMSGELATLLSGRYVELKILPLSFAEFCIGLEMRGETLRKDEAFQAYLSQSSFPYLSRIPTSTGETADYLRGIYNTVLLKDVVARLRIPDVNALENVTKFLLHNIGSRVSPTKIANTLKSEGKGVDPKTVDRYLRGLTDSLILYEAQRFNIKGRQYLSTQSKYYCVDTALRNILVRGRESDAGHLLENIVYLELLRRFDRVFVGETTGGGEVDFVVEIGDGLEYYQVAWTTLDESILRRELAPLNKIRDNYPKNLLTMDTVLSEANYDGIRKHSVLDWLLEK
jgi:predicted AAA+ superfamily ATPase